MVLLPFLALLVIVIETFILKCQDSLESLEISPGLLAPGPRHSTKFSGFLLSSLIFCIYQLENFNILLS